MKTIIKSRYCPKYKNKSQAVRAKVDSPTILPSNLPHFKENLLSGNGLKVFFNYRKGVLKFLN